MIPNHDVHVHNFLSDCSHDGFSTVENYIKYAKAEGLSLIGMANHTWDESIPLPYTTDGWAPEFYRHQSFSYEWQSKYEIPKEIDGLKILMGAETEYCGMYDVLGMGKEAALKLDFLLIPHTHVHMRNFTMARYPDIDAAQRNLEKILLENVPHMTPAVARRMALGMPENELDPYMVGEKIDYIRFVADFMVDSFRSLMNNETLKSYSDLIPVSVAHPFAPVCTPGGQQMLELISDETFGELFSMAAKRGIGLEINPGTGTPGFFRMFGVAKECGCQFTLGSDTHSCGGFKGIQRTKACTDYLGLTQDNMMEFTRT